MKSSEGQVDILAEIAVLQDFPGGPMQGARVRFLVRDTKILHTATWCFYK